jgi:hypothetical protein
MIIEELTCRSNKLEFDPISSYCGWYKGPATRHYDPTHHLFFIKEEKLYRFIGRFHRPGFGYVLPKGFFKSFPAGPDGVLTVCRQIWEQTSPEWQKDDHRFYF